MIIMLENPLARDYYINEAVFRQLSVRELERLIKTNTYEREKNNQINYEDNKKNIDVSIYKDYLPSKEEILKIIKKGEN